MICAVEGIMTHFINIWICAFLILAGCQESEDSPESLPVTQESDGKEEDKKDKVHKKSKKKKTKKEASVEVPKEEAVDEKEKVQKKKKPVSKTPELVFPANACGPEGYQFLLENYFRPNCAGCHYQDSNLHENGFSARDDAFAFSEAQRLSDEQFLSTVNENRLCVDNEGDYPCDLKGSDPMLLALKQWLENRTECPAE